MDADSMTRVVVVDDQTLIREGIVTLLEVAEIKVVGQADDGATALDIIAQTQPDVVLLDLRMPRYDGIWTLEHLRRQGDQTPVLVLTTFDDSTLVFDALRSGAQGYLLKDISVPQLKDAVSTLANGGTLIAPSITDRLLRATASVPAPPSSGAYERPELTDREIEVLRLMASGYTNQDIAEALTLSHGTVKNHVSAILFKLGSKDRTNAVLRGLQDGFLR
ncbi:response regulator transcription factor [Auritidibacter ignavus]|uniref:Response regulator transcription factor n=2 Tax=Micrococcaceae TaxID=1268 RepID=A0AAJ6DD38_9MICC|nr:response regulator transcription factor [Auritidibacter ignavus]WGH93781.1 response regulator transcription factor [Auritidibacter ignavus]